MFFEGAKVHKLLPDFHFQIAAVEYKLPRMELKVLFIIHIRHEERVINLERHLDSAAGGNGHAFKGYQRIHRTPLVAAVGQVKLHHLIASYFPHILHFAGEGAGGGIILGILVFKVRVAQPVTERV